MYTIRTFEYKEWVDISRASWWWEIIYVVMILTYATEEVYGVVKMHWDLRKTKTGLLLKNQSCSRTLLTSSGMGWVVESHPPF